ncbi:hypothetical protein D3C71_89820 [compost metagenome]
MDDTSDIKKAALLSLWGLTVYCMMPLLLIAQNIYTLYSPIMPRYVLWEASRLTVYELLRLLVIMLVAWMAYRKGCYIASIVLVYIPVLIYLLLPFVGLNF